MNRKVQCRQWLARRQQLGLSLAEVSKRSGIPLGTLSYYAWSLRRGADCHKKAHAEVQGGFMEIVPKEPSAHPEIEIVLSSPRSLRVPAGFEESHLARIVRALESC